MSHRTAETRRGFTLIELLVVMSVIAILAGILIPILASARSQAKRAGTLYTLKLISAALGQYSEECGRFPPDSGPATRVAPESLFYYLCTPNLSPKHPYLEPQAGIQTCDFAFTGTSRGAYPGGWQPDVTAAVNKKPEIADGWQYPIYYDITAYPHTTNGFDIWSGGRNLKNEDGRAGTDDLRNW